jgi:hypothetical protein
MSCSKSVKLKLPHTEINRFRKKKYEQTHCPAIVATIPALIPENKRASANIAPAPCPIVCTNNIYIPGKSASLAASDNDAAATIKIAELTKIDTINRVMQSSAIVIDMQDLMAERVGLYSMTANLESEALTSWTFWLLAMSQSLIRAWTSPEPRYIVCGIRVPPRIAQDWYRLFGVISRKGWKGIGERRTLARRRLVEMGGSL